MFWKQIGFALFTFAVYTALLNWKVAAILLVGIGFHECSHLLAAHKIGLKTGGFFMVPFLGGVALIKDKYISYSQQALVVLMGPVGGGVLAALVALLYYLTGYPLFAVAAYWMCLINLFNLLPFSFLDGGQLMDTITYSINKTLGFVFRTIFTCVGVFVIWYFNPVIAIIVAITGFFSFMKEYGNWSAVKNDDLHLASDDYLLPPKALDKAQMWFTISGHLMTAGLLFILMMSLKNIPDASLSTLLHK